MRDAAPRVGQRLPSAQTQHDPWPPGDREVELSHRRAREGSVRGRHPDRSGPRLCAELDHGCASYFSFRAWMVRVSCFLMAASLLPRAAAVSAIVRRAASLTATLSARLA